MVAGFVLCCLFMQARAVAGPDFNGDGTSDVLWRQADGQPILWLMNGLATPVRQPIGIVAGSGASILGTGNFDGAGDTEILWVTSDGLPFIWIVSGGQFAYQCNLEQAMVTPGSAFLGIGDIDGDGKSDVLWLGPDGTVNAWLTDGCYGGSWVALGSAPASASAVAVADFYGTGNADLLWSTPSGYLLWQLGEGGILSTSELDPAIPFGWQLAKTADFDGDGKADLLWRLPDGSLSLSYMDGPSHSDAALTHANTDDIFFDGFENGGAIAGSTSLPSNWQVVDVGDYNGDGHTDILFTSDLGYSQIWKMSGALVQSTYLLPPTPDMPYPGTTGWVLPLDRPVVTQVNGQVSVTWPSLPNIQNYAVYASAQNNPTATGNALTVDGTTLSYARSAPAFAAARYFSVSTNIFGLQTPPSPEAYLLDFDQVDLGYAGPMAITDINGDGCIDILGALGDCHGGFTLAPEAGMGLSALRANGRVWRDLRVADFNGDGIDDVIANVYSYGGDANSRVLLFRGIGNGQFVEDMAFTALGLGGYGETIVVADFDNDGSLDIFLPKYSQCPYCTSADHNYLLINDGHGNFTDMSVSSGVAATQSVYLRPEGAQAADIDGDGRIDLYVGSRLFMNRTTQRGQPVFVDEAAIRGLQPQFDEGAKFIDWNNDGNLDMVLQVPWSGPQIWQSNGYSFQLVDVMPADVAYNQSYGMNAADLDGDGRPDLVVGGGCSTGADDSCLLATGAHSQPKLLLNRTDRYVLSDFYDDGYSSDNNRPWNDLQTFADFDGSGTMDIVSRFPGADSDSGTPSGVIDTKILLNRAGTSRVIHVTVLGPNGERNQFGRVVRVRPMAKPGFVMTDVIDGGSGYMANTPYTLQFAAPWLGAYAIDVRLSDRQVNVAAEAGQNVTIYADGRVFGAASAPRVTLMSPPKQ
ncbi:VCBS repeat-containing protein [Dokdonella soli]|uniref:VCBS repeat-containing protein n=1 Tax=Dokdonella soli TaxID=529810 RepID=A0ABN1IIH5_9GAMM